MARFLRISLVAAALSAFCAAGALANFPVPELSNVPDVMTVTPDASFGFTVNVQGQGGPINGAFVSVHVGGLNDDLLAYCVGQLRAGPDGDDGSYLIASGNTNAGGDVTFLIAGGGCIPTESLGENWVVEVRADGVVLDNVVINSPDIVSTAGLRPIAAGADNCDPQGGGGVTDVGLSDAVSHTGNIALGLTDLCSKMTAPFTDPVALPDAVVLTGYIVAGTSCTCQ